MTNDTKEEINKVSSEFCLALCNLFRAETVTLQNKLTEKDKEIEYLQDEINRLTNILSNNDLL